MTVALYPGSFDPVSNGHVDIARRAAKLFDRLIVGVYDAPPKTLLFSTQERVGLFSKAVEDVPNIEVVPYQELTAHFARTVGARVLVRGLRASSDFEYEFDWTMMNRKLVPEVEVICLVTRLEYQFLRSSLLKEACALGGDISSLVPEHVDAALKAKMRPGRTTGRRP